MSAFALEPAEERADFINQFAMLERVRLHKSRFFASSWANYPARGCASVAEA